MPMSRPTTRPSPLVADMTRKLIVMRRRSVGRPIVSCGPAGMSVMRAGRSFLAKEDVEVEVGALGGRSPQLPQVPDEVGHGVPARFAPLSAGAERGTGEVIGKEGIEEIPVGTGPAKQVGIELEDQDFGPGEREPPARKNAKL